MPHKIKFQKYLPPLLFFLISLTLVLFVSVWLNSIMTDVKTKIISYLENKLQREIHFSGISPAIFQYIEIRDLSIFKEKGPKTQKTAPLLKINQLRIYYHPWALFRFNDLSFIKELRIENSHFSFDQEGDKDLLELFQNNQENSGISRSLLENIKLGGHNISFDYSGKWGKLKCQKLFFSIQPFSQRQMINLKGQLQINLKKETAGFRFAKSNLSIEGDTARNFDWVSLDLKLSDFKSNMFSLSKQNFYLLKEQELWLLKKVEDVAPFNLDIRFNQQNMQSEVDFEAEKFYPLDWFKFQPEFREIASWLSFTISGSGHLKYNLQNRESRYNIDSRIYLRNYFFKQGVNINVLAKGTEKKLDINSLQINNVHYNLGYQGSMDLVRYFPEGLLSIKRISLPNKAKISGDLRFLSEKNTLQIQGIGLKHSLLGELKAQINIVKIIQKPLFDFTSKIGIKDKPYLSTAGRIDLKQPKISGQITLEKISLDKVLLVLLKKDDLPSALSPFLEQILLASQIDFSIDQSKFQFQSAKTFLEQKEKTKNSLHCQFNFTNKSLDLTNIDFNWEENKGKGEFLLNFLSNNNQYLISNFQLNGNRYQLAGPLNFAKGIFLSGDYITISAAPQQSQSYKTRIIIKELPLNWDNQKIKISLDCQSLFTNPQDWQIMVFNQKTSGLSLYSNPNAELNWSGIFFPESAKIFRIQFNDGYSRLQGSAFMEYFLSGRTALDGWLSLNDPDKRESYLAQIHLKDRKLRGNLFIENSPIERWTDLYVNGLFNGNLQIAGNIDDPKAQLEISVEQGAIQTLPFTFASQFSINKDEIQCTSLNMDIMGAKFYNGKGFLNLKNGIFKAELEHESRIRNKELTFKMELSGNPGKNKAPASQNKGLPSLLADMQIKNIKWEKQSIEAWNMRIQTDNEKIKFWGGPGSAFTGWISIDGELAMEASRPFPFQFMAKGKLGQNKINMDIDKLEFDVAALGEVFPLLFINLEKGKGEGKISLRGPLWDPGFYGFILLKNVVASTPYVTEKIGPFSGRINFEDEIIFPRIFLPVKDTGAYVDGQIKIDQYFLEDYVFNFKIEGDKGPPLALWLLGLDIKGHAIGDLQISGNMEEIFFNGDLLINNCTIELAEKPGEDFAELNNDPAAAGLAYWVDLRLETGRRVEFKWNLLSWFKLESYARTGNVIEIYSNGVTEEFSMKGNVDIQGGEVRYIDKTFYLKEGFLRFNEDQEYFDPAFSVRGEIRDQFQGQPIKIYLLAEGNLFSPFNPRFESNPILSETEIQQLLGQPIEQYAEELSEQTIQAIISRGTGMLTKIGLLRPLENLVKRIFRLDLFSLETEAIENILLDRLPGNSELLQRNEPSLGKYLDNTSVFLGKYISDDLFLQGLFRLKSKDIDSERILDTLEIESEIGIELTTPYFIIDWTLRPQNIENLFVTDNYITIKWKFSF